MAIDKVSVKMRITVNQPGPVLLGRSGRVAVVVSGGRGDMSAIQCFARFPGEHRKSGARPGIPESQSVLGPGSSPAGRRGRPGHEDSAREGSVNWVTQQAEAGMLRVILLHRDGGTFRPRVAT